MKMGKVPELPDIQPDERGAYYSPDVRRYNLCRLMIERGWSTDDFAMAYGKSNSAVYQWITGIRNIGNEALPRIAECFEVSKEEFDLRPIPELNLALRTLSGRRATLLKKILSLCQREEEGDVLPEILDYIENNLIKVEELSKK